MSTSKTRMAVAVLIAIGVVLVSCQRSVDSKGDDQSTVNDPIPTNVVRTLAKGTFAPQQHVTSGTAVLLELSDGTKLLRLENLDLTNAPNLHVWLTEQLHPWPELDKPYYADLGNLKANKGNQNYPISADTHFDRFNGVDIRDNDSPDAFAYASMRLE